MPNDPKDPPIIEPGYLAGLKVVDIGDIRVARGMSRRPVSVCKHRRLLYDQSERRVWCKDCETNVEAFDAFLQVCEQFNAAAQRIERDREAVDAAKAHNIIRIAAKRLDEMFRRKHMVPSCPHCRAGILPEDVERMGMVGRDFELARRGKIKGNDA